MNLFGKKKASTATVEAVQSAAMTGLKASFAAWKDAGQPALRIGGATVVAPVVVKNNIALVYHTGAGWEKLSQTDSEYFIRQCIKEKAVLEDIGGGFYTLELPKK
jgi:hypothetical protein